MDAFSSFCERAYFSLRYGPFRVVIWPISGREMGLIGVRNGLFRRTDGAKRGCEMPGTGFSGGIFRSEIFWNEKIGMLNAVSWLWADVNGNLQRRAQYGWGIFSVKTSVKQRCGRQVAGGWRSDSKYIIIRYILFYYDIINPYAVSCPFVSIASVAASRPFLPRSRQGRQTCRPATKWNFHGLKRPIWVK